MGGRYLFFSWAWSLDIYRKTFYRYSSTSCSINLTFLELVKFVTCVFSETFTSNCLENCVVEEWIKGSGICGKHSCRSELSYFPLSISAALIVVPINKGPHWCLRLVIETRPLRRLINETQRQIIALCVQRTTSVIKFSAFVWSALYTGPVFNLSYVWMNFVFWLVLILDLCVCVSCWPCRAHKPSLLFFVLLSIITSCVINVKDFG